MCAVGFGLRFAQALTLFRQALLELTPRVGLPLVELYPAVRSFFIDTLSVRFDALDALIVVALRVLDLPIDFQIDVRTL